MERPTPTNTSDNANDVIALARGLLSDLLVIKPTLVPKREPRIDTVLGCSSHARSYDSRKDPQPCELPMETAFPSMPAHQQVAIAQDHHGATGFA